MDPNGQIVQFIYQLVELGSFSFGDKWFVVHPVRGE